MLNESDVALNPVRNLAKVQKFIVEADSCRTARFFLRGQWGDRLETEKGRPPNQSAK